MAFCTSSCPTTGAPPSPSCTPVVWSKGRSNSLKRRMRRRALHRLGARSSRSSRDVLRGVARVDARRLEKRLHVFLESEDRLVRHEGTADPDRDGL